MHFSSLGKLVDSWRSVLYILFSISLVSHSNRESCSSSSEEMAAGDEITLYTFSDDGTIGRRTATIAVRTPSQSSSETDDWLEAPSNQSEGDEMERKEEDASSKELFNVPS